MTRLVYLAAVVLLHEVCVDAAQASDMLKLTSRLYDSSADVDALFDEYVESFGKSYSDQERVYRLECFRLSVERIRDHMRNADTHTYTLGLNEHSDWSDVERAQLRGYIPNPNPNPNPSHGSLKPFGAKSSLGDSYTSLDWRYPSQNPMNVTAVSSIKNQGSCGACWAFAVCAATEGNVAINSGGILNDLSEQELIDCDTLESGCNGGTLPAAYSYIKKYGLTSYSNYPYTGTTGTCLSESYEPASAITGYASVKSCSDSSTVAALEATPLSIGIDASCYEFQAYSSGVFTTSCGQSMDHAVTIVGYGTDSSSGLNYYTLKNSWGKSWGESGYMRIWRDTSSSCGTCGMLLDVEYAKGGYTLTNSSDLVVVDDDTSSSGDVVSFNDYYPFIYAAIAIIAVAVLVSTVSSCIRSRRYRRDDDLGTRLL